MLALVRASAHEGADGRQPTLMGSRKLQEGSTRSCDRLFVEKIGLLSWLPARGDIVVFKTKGIAHPTLACHTQVKAECKIQVPKPAAAQAKEGQSGAV